MSRTSTLSGSSRSSMEERDRCGGMGRLRPFPALQGAQVRNDGARYFFVLRILHEAFDNALVQRDAVYFPKEY